MIWLVWRLTIVAEYDPGKAGANERVNILKLFNFTRLVRCKMAAA